MQAHVVTAPGDGVAPAVLLSLPASDATDAATARKPPAQYLFNVPEGFARLVLEHKLRPGAGLRAAFTPHPAALSGFGGLVMRLRGEGHSQLHVVGPPGTQAAVCSLRHFVHWRHPAVVLEEASPWEAPVLYQDDRIAVAALWKPPLLAGMWPAPAWLQQARPPERSKHGAAAANGGSSGSEESSSSEESSGREGSGTDESSGAESSSSSGGGSSSGNEGDQTQQQQQLGGQSQQAQACDGQGGMFDALDKLFMSGQGGRRLALDTLKRASAAGAATGACGPVAGASRAAPTAATASHRQQQAAAATAAAKAAKSAATVAAPARRRQPVADPTDAGEADDVAVIGGKRFRRLPAQAGINVWVCQKLASKGAAAGAAVGGSVGQGQGLSLLSQQQDNGQQQRQHCQQQSKPQMLGFVCHLRGTDQLLLLTNLHSRAAAAQLQQHPALALLARQSERVAAVLHVAAPGVAGSRALRQLCQHLRPAVQGPAAGQQLLLEQPGAHGSGQVVGHLASARTTAKLNLVSSRMFPLPAGMDVQRHRASAPVAEGQQAEAAAGAPAGADGNLTGTADAASGLAAGEQHVVKACEEAATAERTTGGPSSSGAAGAAPTTAAAQLGATSSGGLVHVRQLSMLSWRQQEVRQADTAVADPPAASNPDGTVELEPQMQLTIEPAEGFASAAPGGFDAAAVQQEVQQERPQLGAQLELLSGRQQRGELPGPDELEADGLPAWPCRQNHVAPPLPPLPPSLLVLPAQQQGWQQPMPATMMQQPWIAVPGPQHIIQQHHIAYPPPPPSAQQQAWQQQPPPGQQQGGIMRPLYHQQPPAALHAAAQRPQYHQLQHQRAMQPYAWPPPPGMLLMPAPPPGPPPGQPPAQQALADQLGAVLPPGPQNEDQQQKAGPDNKRAAGDLKARLQGAKRQRQGKGMPSDTAAGTTGVTDELADQGRAQQNGEAPSGQQHEQSQQQPVERQPWLVGAPPGICQLAARQFCGSVSVNSSGSGSSGGPEVLFLGTGSAEPSKYRGASAIQLRLSCGQSLLLDCGEGTLGALCRAHGTAAALRHVASLGCLWVSHRHADHMSGVLPLLAAYPASLPPLLVVGPLSLRDWLAEAAGTLGLTGHYVFVHCAELNQPCHWARQVLQHHLGICDVQCVPVRHCSDAYGLVLRHKEGWSLVYSGDTQPCQQLVQAGRGCSLLIHEATFEPCLQSQARAKRHSTTAEALDVAQRMGAYRCILTHFSQRYPKWPEGLPLAADASPAGPPADKGAANEGEVPAVAGGTVAVAFDGMRVPLALLPVLPALMPAVQAALADVEEEEEEHQQGREQQELQEALPTGSQQQTGINGATNDS